MPLSLVLPPLAAGALYARGVARVWRRAGIGRGVARGSVAAFQGGLLAFLLATVSPLHGAGEILFSAHMLQHLMLVLVAAPLLVLGRPGRAWAWGLPRPVRGRAARLGAAIGRLAGPLARPLPAVGVATATIWVWHAPALYDLAVTAGWAHAIEHGTFLGSAILFWGSVLRPRSARSATGNGVRLVALFAMVVQGSLLGALITFAGSPLYTAHLAIPPGWGLTPLEDQQLAGLLMWIPPAALYLGVATHLVLRWLDAAGHGAFSLVTHGD